MELSDIKNVYKYCKNGLKQVKHYTSEGCGLARDVYKELAKELPQSYRMIYDGVKSAPQKLGKATCIATFLLPTLAGVGIAVSNTSGDSSSSSSEKYVIVDSPSEDVRNNTKYLDVKGIQGYIVKKGDNISSIAKAHGVSVERLLAANFIDAQTIIHQGDSLIIPEAYSVKNVDNLKDVGKLMKLDNDFLKTMVDFEKVHSTIYEDRNGNKTIGIGHLVKSDEISKYNNRELTKEEIYTLFAEDLLKKDLNLRVLLGDTIYDSMPSNLRESVLDLAFNKGEGAIRDNKNLRDALVKKDYIKAAANLNQDYSVVKNKKGEKIKKYASGLSKRRLFDIYNASKMFDGNIPKDVIQSAKKVYEDGLVYLQKEFENGEFTQSEYKNVKTEYEKLAKKWFKGKLTETEKVDVEETVGGTSGVPSGDYSVKSGKDKMIYVDGTKTSWNKQSLYADWGRTAASKLRFVKRPEPVIDSKGNIVAYVKEIAPKKSGPLSGKTIIVNPGHGGAVASKNGKGKVNVNFDPGASNAVMSKKNPNIETNKFIGNGGKALEEWVVNERLSNELVERIINQGGKVIFVQGSVYTAMDAIRKIVKKDAADLMISLHSNSAGDKRGIIVIGSNRGGVDREDKKLSNCITSALNKDSWFKGITSQSERKLGVLSASSLRSLPIPAVMVETGNLKNEKDVANLNSSAFKKKMVDAIFAGMKDYFD